MDEALGKECLVGALRGEAMFAYENAGNGTAEPGETDDDEDLEREGLPVG